jgi:hypothetical protein
MGQAELERAKRCCDEDDNATAVQFEYQCHFLFVVDPPFSQAATVIFCGARGGPVRGGHAALCAATPAAAYLLHYYPL